MENIKKIVTIGGGSGHYILLSGLRDMEGIDISAVVSMVDSGGSTGRLRDELGVLPPGDILKCLLALSPDREAARKILLTKFNNNERLKGHNAGNMLLSILSQFAGNFADGVNALAEILGVKGQIHPVTTDKATLVAELTDGSRLFGEKAIDIPRGNQREKITNAYLVPHFNDVISVHPPVIASIKKADYIILGPGDLFTSIIPNFLVPGVKEAVIDSNADIIYVLNIMTKFGETENFKPNDFVREIEARIGKNVNYVIINKSIPEIAILNEYEKQKAELILNDENFGWGERNIIREDLIEFSGQVVRHDPKKLGETINKIIYATNS
jgi:uncharacterized cofD-like protein